MSGFGANISSLRAQRRLSEGTHALSQTFERLSTGQRINRASDDAAGLAIADSLRVRSRLYGAASRNINDALSMINIADSTLDNQTSILVRLKELAEQSANGVFSSAQRETMNREYMSLVSEFGRLGDTSSFNGLSLLRAGGSLTNIQAGIDGGASSNISFASGETGSLSGVIDLDDNLDPSNFVGSGTFAAIAESYRNHLFRTTMQDNTGATRDILVVIRDPGGGGYAGLIHVDIYARTAEVATAGGDTLFGTPISAGDEWSLAGRGHIARDADTGRLSNFLPGTSQEIGLLSVAFASGVGGTYRMDLSALQVLSTSASGKPQSVIEFTGIENVARARDALDVLSRRLDDVATLRGQYGATQSRLATALSLLYSTNENTQAAESRIRDVDVASESARLTSLQILQQAAASVLATANQQPQLLLSLLRSG